MSWKPVLNIFPSDDLSGHYNGLYACYLDDNVMEWEWGERLGLSGVDLSRHTGPQRLDFHPQQNTVFKVIKLAVVFYIVLSVLVAFKFYILQ